MRTFLVLAAAAILASCPRIHPGVSDVRAPDLETAAVLRGLIRDPGEADLVGLYARDADRVCVVRQGAGYRIGAHVDYGDTDGCDAAGAAQRSGERLRVILGEDCRFDARFDGDRIVFPATLPDACAKFCGRRASFATLNVERLSESAAEAATMRGARGQLPCAGD